MKTTDPLLSQPLRCARCEQPLEASRVDLVTKLATCAQCNRVFTIDPATVIAGTRAVIPDTIEAFVSGDALEAPDPLAPAMAWSHRAPRAVGILYVCLGSFATLFFGTMGVASIATELRPIWAIGLMMAILTVVGVLLVYAGVRSLRTRTVIAVEATEITVRDAAARSPTRSIPRGDAVAADASSNHVTGWAVRVIGRNRRGVVLLGALRQEEARFLAGEIERALAARREVAA